MEEKDFSKSIKLTFIILFGVSLFWFLFACQFVWAYDPGGSPLDLKKNSRVNDTILIQPGTGTSGGSDTARFRTFYGTQACVGVGSNGYILSGTLTGLPFIDYLYGNGSSTINFSGFTHVAIGGSDIPAASLVDGKINAVAGTGTTNVFTDTTLAGQGTLTATLRANGVDISPTEVGYLDGVSSNVQTQITTATGSITNHTHTGSDGTTQIAHNNVTGTGTNSHATIDNFISSKAAASGLASLDGSSKVVQDPANATSTPTAAKIPISLGTGKLDDSWLSDNITKLGTPTTDNISEGSTNKYYTDARVNATIGSSSITSPQVSPKITFTSPAAGQFLKIVDSQGNVENGTSSVSVGFDGITGVPTDNAYFKTEAGTSTVPVRDVLGNLFVSGIVGGTTTGALRIPVGTTAQRPGTPTLGMIRLAESVYPTVPSGGTITISGTYTVHTFTSSGVFIPCGTITSNNLEFYDGTVWRVYATGTQNSVSSPSQIYDILTIAGGGGGGGVTDFGGGGGGAGGMKYQSTSLPMGSYTVTIGAGGASTANGNSTSIGTITVTGGGAGGVNYDNAGSNGGSGGGGSGGNLGTAAGGTGVSGEGYDGGAGANGSPWYSGGGGGAGAVGTAGNGSTSGAGGIGGQNSISGSNLYYAGGGGGGRTSSGANGGAGGSGGGGAGGLNGSGVNGSSTTGGGGGGGGGSGGSGIVIIRYPTP